MYSKSPQYGDAREREFSLPGITLAAREWGRRGARPVLALHGWLDNAASFDVLAPLLADCHLIALDLPGQGLSQHKSPQGSYNLWDDLLDLMRVADQLGWTRFHLLGHSRGALISLLLAAALPERIVSVALLEALWPEPVTIEETAAQLGRHLRDNLALGDKQPTRYAGPEEAVAVLQRATGIAEPSAQRLVTRGLVQRDGRWYWRADPRLRTASALKLTRAHSEALVRALQVPALLLLAESGVGGRMNWREALGQFSQLRWKLMPGSHHFHMEAQAPMLAAEINTFWQENPHD
ncbi:MAG TPA: alpha/beta hydrolase [Spongiibacteraceae bacterium]|nr:alpha/beta hydrolase [Spongiibacteraceae bacterium]